MFTVSRAYANVSFYYLGQLILCKMLWHKSLRNASGLLTAPFRADLPIVPKC